MTGSARAAAVAGAWLVLVCASPDQLPLGGGLALGQLPGDDQTNTPATAPGLGSDTASPSDTSAAPNPLAGTIELDARAAAFAALRPTDLGDGFALMDLLSGIFPGVVGGFDRARDSVGLYAFSRSELADRGVDPDALVLLSWGQIDAGDWTARKPGKRSAPLVFARHRVVLKVGAGGAADETKLEAAFTHALEKRGGTVVHLPRVPHVPWPAWVKTINGVAKRARVRLCARGAAGDLFALRFRDGRAVIDWAEPWAGVARPSDDLRVPFAKMMAAPRKRLSEDLARPPRPLLASPESSVSIVLVPSALAGLAPHESCRDDWANGAGALLDESALLLRMHPFDWKLEIVWALTPAGHVAFDAAAADDGLGDGRALVHEAHGAAGLLVSSFDALDDGGLPRDRLARLLDALHGRDIGCGATGLLAALGRYWPQTARASVANVEPAIVGTPPDGRPRNVVACFGDPSPDRRWADAVTYFLSFPQPASPSLERALAAAGARGERQTFGDRQPLFFDFGAGARFDEAAIESLAGGRIGLALSPPGTSLGWYYRLRRHAALFGAQSNVGFLQVNVARLLGKLAESADAGTQAAVKLAASQFGLLGGNLTRDDNTLHLDLTLSPP